MISWPIRVLGASGVFRRKQHDVSFRSHEFFGITRHASTFRLKYSWIAGTTIDMIVGHAGRVMIKCFSEI